MKLPTCKDVSRLASDDLERELSFRERWGLRLHLWVCRNCRRFLQQLRFLRRASRQALQEQALPGRLTLSGEARDRIKKGLGSERGSIE